MRVRCIGGCCGSEQSHTGALAEELGKELAEVVEQGRSVARGSEEHTACQGLFGAFT